ncbi:MAG: right-handed parallel beta-helix repeat-containing protein, partial [Melioribacteraceae bacterium]|nr:right-handed parallel beta-helix repeat-containing protein [Melioribacteraceae bacterium]
MKIFCLITFIIMSLTLMVEGTPLQKIYDYALPFGEYDKLIILHNDVIYTGGFIQDVEKVCIQGNGAIIDLQGENILVDGNDKEILIHHCIIISTSEYNNYFLLKNGAYGSFVNNTFYSIEDSFAPQTCISFEECNTNNSNIYNNIFVNFREAVFFYTLEFLAPIALEISNNDVWNCSTGYLYWGGWTGPPTPFIPSPGNSEMIEDPKFVNPSEWDFNLQAGSQCIDAGSDFGYAFHSFGPDLGAKESEYSNFIGTKIRGNLSGELVVDNSPYIIEDDIIVPAGGSLKILPGVVLKINTFKSFLVYGTLSLEGSDMDSVYLQNNSIYNKYWGGIVFFPQASNESIISKVNITNAGSYSEKGTIYCSNDSVTIIDNNFSNNTGAVYCESSSYPRISNNIFFEKSDFTGRRVIYCAQNSKPIIENNEFFCSSIYCSSAKPIIKKNKFMGQDYSVAQQYWLLTLVDSSDAYVEANLFANNYGAVLVKSSTCTSYNNLFIKCTNQYLFTDDALGHIYNNTIYPENFGIRSSRNSTVYVVNSIVWRYGSYGYALQTFDSSKIYPSYCILSDQFDGENIIYQNPLFVDSSKNDFHLLPASPAIDSGTQDTSSLHLPSADFDNNNRIYNNRIDMGCYEYVKANSILNFHKLTSTYNLIQNYPNPFNPTTTIKFSISNVGDENIRPLQTVKLIIYD